mgnify:CR=1 FL=1
MRNLFLLFIKYGHIFLFLFLEFVCFILIVRYNRAQNEIYLNSANIVSGAIYSKVNNVSEYFKLDEVADSLANENARLRKLLYNSSYQSVTNVDSIFNQDSVFQYSYLVGKVVNNSINLNNNKFTINKGSKDGVKPRMGIINSNGVVGIIKDVKKNYSVALSLLNRQVKISVSLKNNGSFGSLAWKGIYPNILNLEDVPKHSNISIGDTVVTSGYSSKFPPNLMIGVIDTFWLEPGFNSYTIEVDLNNDLSRLNYVYIIDNILIEEQREIEALSQ